MFPSFYFKVEKIIRAQTGHLTPQRRKCIESVLLTMSHELHCYSKGEKPTANTLLGLGKLHPSRQMGGGAFSLSWFCFVCLCHASIRSVLHFVSHTQCAQQYLECIMLAVISALQRFHLEPNHQIQNKTKSNKPCKEDSCALFSLWIIFDHKRCFS